MLRRLVKLPVVVLERLVLDGLLIVVRVIQALRLLWPILLLLSRVLQLSGGKLL
jgi:hypothetical protein